MVNNRELLRAKKLEREKVMARIDAANSLYESATISKELDPIDEEIMNLKYLIEMEDDVLRRAIAKADVVTSKTQAQAQLQANLQPATAPEGVPSASTSSGTSTLTNVKTAKTVDPGVKSNTYEGNVYLSDTTQQLNRETVKQVNYDHPEQSASAKEAEELEKTIATKWGEEGSTLRSYNETVQMARISNPVSAVKNKYAHMDMKDPKVKAAYDAEIQAARWESRKNFFTGLLPPIKANQGCATFPNCPTCSFLNTDLDVSGISNSAAKIGNNLRNSGASSGANGFTQGVMGALNCLQQVQKSKVATFIASIRSASTNGNIGLIDKVVGQANPLVSNNPIRGNVATATVRMEQNPTNIDSAFNVLNAVGVSKNDVFKTSIPPVAGASTTAIYDLDKYSKSVNGGTSFITQALGDDQGKQFISIANLSANRNALTQRTVTKVDNNGKTYTTTEQVPLQLSSMKNTSEADTIKSSSVYTKANSLGVLPGDTTLDLIPSTPDLNTTTSTNLSPYREDIVYLI